jgi:HK97 family phage prohead protease
MKKKKIYGLGEFVFKGLQEDGTFDAVISGVKTDRYGDTINPDGWELKNFKKNPVLLWAHDHTIPTVGRALKVWVEGKNLMMKGEFAPTPFAQELKLLAEQGFLNAFSVGFMPIDYKFNDNGVDFLSQELLEVSFVNVPAYAEALMKGVEANKENLKTFMKETDCTMTWKGILDNLDGREELLQEKDKRATVEEEKVTFTKSEFEAFKKEIEQKAGKVLSKKNRDLLTSAIGAMENAITPLKDLLEATTDEADSDKGGSEAGGRTKAPEAKQSIEIDARKLVQIANKAIEGALIKMRAEAREK